MNIPTEQKRQRLLELLLEVDPDPSVSVYGAKIYQVIKSGNESDIKQLIRELKEQCHANRIVTERMIGIEAAHILLTYQL